MPGAALGRVLVAIVAIVLVLSMVLGGAFGRWY